tara:strand:- start:1981 stop:2103 length:123 start_codon:yes stop_codon:yes gene_type:complete
MKNTEIKPKVRKVRCDKGISKKPKPPVKEFKPNETITLIL